MADISLPFLARRERTFHAQERLFSCIDPFNGGRRGVIDGAELGDLNDLRGRVLLGVDTDDFEYLANAGHVTVEADDSDGSGRTMGDMPVEILEMLIARALDLPSATASAPNACIGWDVLRRYNALRLVCPAFAAVCSVVVRRHYNGRRLPFQLLDSHITVSQNAARWGIDYSRPCVGMACIWHYTTQAQLSQQMIRMLLVNPTAESIAMIFNVFPWSGLLPCIVAGLGDTRTAEQVDLVVGYLFRHRFASLEALVAERVDKESSEALYNSVVVRGVQQYIAVMQPDGSREYVPLPPTSPDQFARFVFRDCRSTAFYNVMPLNVFHDIGTGVFLHPSKDVCDMVLAVRARVGAPIRGLFDARSLLPALAENQLSPDFLTAMEYVLASTAFVDRNFCGLGAVVAVASMLMRFTTNAELLSCMTGLELHQRSRRDVLVQQCKAVKKTMSLSTMSGTRKSYPLANDFRACLVHIVRICGIIHESLYDGTGLLTTREIIDLYGSGCPNNKTACAGCKQSKFFHFTD